MEYADTLNTFLIPMLVVAAIASLIAMSAFIVLALHGNSATLLTACSNRPTRTSVVTTSIPVRTGRRLSWRQRIFLLMAAIGFLVCFYKGAETMLFWMPENWGHLSDDGDFHLLKSTIAGLFALIGGGIFFQYSIDSARKGLCLRLAATQISWERKIQDAESREALNSLRNQFAEKMNELKPIASDLIEPSGPIVAADLEMDMYRDLTYRTNQLLEKRR